MMQSVRLYAFYFIAATGYFYLPAITKKIRTIRIFNGIARDVRKDEQKVVDRKILHLSLKNKWFKEILEGKKKIEYRKIKPYWTKRLEGKEYDHIHFVNGYGKDKPWMDVVLLKIEKDDAYYDEYQLHLGEVIKKGNIK